MLLDGFAPFVEVPCIADFMLIPIASVVVDNMANLKLRLIAIKVNNAFFIVLKST